EHSMQLAGVCLAISATCMTGEVQAQFATAGSEFRVSSVTNSVNRLASVAMDSDGDFVVTWEHGDGSSIGIYAQLYSATGVAKAPEFTVNTYTTDLQVNPSVAMDSDGDFVITWQSNLQDGSLYGIYAQRYNALGVAQGSEFRVNTTTTSLQANPTI